MESCRTCRFASIINQQCRQQSPQVFPVMTQRGPMPLTVFPGLPPDNSGCGAHEPADALELERREREHPIATSEVPDGPRVVTS